MADRIVSPVAVDAVAFTGTSWRAGEDGERGVYVLAAPRGDGNSFTSAAVYASTAQGAGECWQRLGTIRAPATMGFVQGWDAGVIPDHVPGDDGTGYSIQVEMLHGELESFASIGEARCARQNLALVGRELLRFQTATLQGDGVSYVVTGFERGLYGTNPTGHVDSERFTVLDDNAAFVPLPPEAFGQDLYLRIVPVGYTVDDVESITLQVPDVPDLSWQTVETATAINQGLDARVRRSVQRFRAVDTGDGVELRWDDVGDPNLSHYEIRVGSQWGGAPVVDRVRARVLAIPRVVTTARTYRIRAVYVGGMLSPTEATVTLTPSVPDAQTTAIATTDVPPELSGHDGTEVDGSGRIILSDGELSGTYTATEVDASSAALRDWIVHVDSHHQYLVPVDEWKFPLGSLESFRWTSAGREPVADDHGGDPDTPVEDFPAPEDWGTSWTTLGRRGSVTDFTRLLVEIRFDTTGSGDWTEWEEYEPKRREAQKCQVRVTLSRVSSDWQRYVTAIRVEART